MTNDEDIIVASPQDAEAEKKDKYGLIAADLWNMPLEAITSEQRNLVKKNLTAMSYGGRGTMTIEPDALRASFERVSFGAVLPKRWMCPSCKAEQDIEVVLYSTKHFDPELFTVYYNDLERDAIICTECCESLDELIPEEQQEALYRAAFKTD